MTRWTIAVTLFIAGQRLVAQGNLVPNPGLELHSNCPGNAQFQYCIGWNNPNPPSSPDYYHMCSTTVADVPNNTFGVQFAHSDSAYVGIVSFTWSARENIQAQLLDTLEAGATYCVSYFVSLAERSDYATIPPQLYFSDTAMTSGWMGFVVTPHIMDPNINSDSTNWLQIQGEYTAHGGEKFVVIGHFFDNESTIYDSVGAGIDFPGAYFYIDDISVIKKLNASAGDTATICLSDSVQLGSTPDSGVMYSWFPSFGLSDSTSPHPWAEPMVTTTYYLSISDTGNLYCPGNLVDSVTITVNDCSPISPLNAPTILNGNEVFYITSLPANSDLKIYDVRGRLVANKENYQNDFSVVNLEAAVYLYELTLPDLTVQKGKFCVVR